MTAHSLTIERTFWNKWNVTREFSQGRVSTEQRAVVQRWLDAIGRRDLELIDVGCGAGWLCEKLVPYGRVVGTDLSDEVLARSGQRAAEVEFVAGDFMQLDFGRERFDVAFSLEVLTHVADQPAFLRKIAASLKPGGRLMLAAQNRSALQRNNIAPPEPGQVRRWVDRDELRRLLQVDFEIEELFSITPQYNRGLLKIINSDKLRRLLNAIGLGFILNLLTRLQERAWMGWTLMALARKR